MYYVYVYTYKYTATYYLHNVYTPVYYIIICICVCVCILISTLKSEVFAHTCPYLKAPYHNFSGKTTHACGNSVHACSNPWHLHVYTCMFLPVQKLVQYTTWTYYTLFPYYVYACFCLSRSCMSLQLDLL